MFRTIISCDVPSLTDTQSIAVLDSVRINSLTVVVRSMSWRLRVIQEELAAADLHDVNSVKSAAFRTLSICGKMSMGGLIEPEADVTTKNGLRFLLQICHDHIAIKSLDNLGEQQARNLLLLFPEYLQMSNIVMSIGRARKNDDEQRIRKLVR